MTLRAQRLLQAADIIVHDASISEAVIQMGRRDAERLVMSGEASPICAAEIGSELARLAQDGKRVVRLVAGDARETGATGIEIATARRAGLFTTIVPGVAVADSTAAETQRVA